MPSRFLLDTNVCIDLIRGYVPTVGSEIRQIPLDAASISSVTLAELEVGVAKSSVPGAMRRLLEEFLDKVEVADFNRAAARHYGEIRGHLEKKGMAIGPMDLLIAAHSRSLDADLITANAREFRRVPGLRCFAWKESRHKPGKRSSKGT